MNLSNDHRLSETNKHEQSAKGAVYPYSPESRHHTLGERLQVVRSTHGKLRTKDTHSMDIFEWCHAGNRGRVFIKCAEPINTTMKAARMELWRGRLEPPKASVHLNISGDEHLPAGEENLWTTRKALNRLCTQVGRSRVNMLNWECSIMTAL